MKKDDYIRVELEVIDRDLLTRRPDRMRVTAPGLEPFVMDVPDVEVDRDWQDTLHDALKAEIEKRQP